MKNRNEINVVAISLTLLLVCTGASIAETGRALGDCDAWQLMNPLPAAEDLNSVAYGNGLYVAAGDNGTVLSSADRISWSVVDTGVDANLSAITFGAAGWSVVGENGMILHSADGVMWRAADSPVSENLFAVAAGDDEFVAAGENGTILSSTDGLTWIEQSSGTNSDLFDVLFTGDLFVIGGARGTLLVSPDGQTWHNDDLEIETDVMTMAHHHGLILLITSVHQIFASQDDDAWGLIGWVDGDPNEVIWAHDRFVIAGNRGRHFYSYDGFEWSRDANSAEYLDLLGVAFGPPGFVGVGTGGHVAFGDGEHWTVANAMTTGTLREVIANEERVLAGGGSNTMWYSEAGPLQWQQWTGEILMGDTTAWGNNIFVSIVSSFHGSSTFLATSQDGLHWQDLFPGVSFSDIEFDGSRFVACSSYSHLGISTDGINWSISEPLGSVVTNAVASNGTIVVIALNGGRFEWTADDGETWTNSGFISPTVQDMTWGNGFVAVGDEGNISWSPDGQSWQEAYSGVDSGLIDVLWTGDFFVAVGKDGVVLVSDDGINWQQHQSATGNDLHSAAVFGDQLVAVGDNGVIQRLYCVDADQPPITNFSWRPFIVEAGQSVLFEDLSAGDPDTWAWQFADGGEASTSSAMHVFANPGTYEVRLAASNQNGTDVAASVVEVIADCSNISELPVLSGPDAVGSGIPFTIWWTPGDADGYWFERSNAPEFDGSYTISYRVDATSSRLIAQIKYSEYHYFRIAPLKECSGGLYQGDWSNTLEIEVVPVVSSPGRYSQIVGSATVAEGPWTTSLTLHNPGTEMTRASLFPLDGEYHDSFDVYVPAHQSIEVDDIATKLQSDAIKTGILIGSNQPLLVNGVTAKNTDSGSVGHVSPGSQLRFNQRLGRKIVLTGLASDHISVLGFTNAYARDEEVTIDLLGADGSLIERLPVEVPRFSTLILDEITNQGEPAYATVQLATEYPDALTAWVESSDPDTGDSTLQVAAEQQPWVAVGREGLPKLQLNTETWNAVIRRGETYVAAGVGHVAWSVNGNQWTVMEIEEEFWAADLQCNGDIFVVVGPGVWTSNDGRSWSRQELPSGFEDFGSVVWTGEQWFAVDPSSGGVASSFDGMSWVPTGQLQMSDCRLSWTGEELMASCWTGIASSEFGIDWQTEFVVGTFFATESNGTVVVAVGDDSIWTRDENKAWRQSFDQGRDRIVWTGRQFFAWTDDAYSTNPGEALVSNDGFVWSAVPLGAHLAPESLFWTGEAVVGIQRNGDLTWIKARGIERVIPAVAKAGGAFGANWISHLELVNTTSDPMGVTLQFLPRGQANIDALSHSMQLQSEQSLSIVDVLSTVFDLEGVGGLRILPDASGLEATSRTVHDSGDGSLAQTVPAFGGDDTIASFEQGWLMPLRHAVDKSTGYRSNIGLVSNCEIDMTVQVNLFKANGFWIGYREVQLQPFEVLQLNDVFRHYTTENIDHGHATLSSPTIGCGFYAYASVIDNQNNSALTVPAARLPSLVR